MAVNQQPRGWSFFTSQPPVFLPSLHRALPPSPHKAKLGILGTCQHSPAFHPAPPKHKLSQRASSPWSIPSRPMRMGLVGEENISHFGGRPFSHPSISLCQLSFASQLVFSLLPAGGCHVREEGKETMQRKLISMA